MRRVRDRGRTKQLSADLRLPPIVMRRLQEMGLTVVLFFGFFLTVSLLTYHQIDPGWSHAVASGDIRNAGGRVGAWLSDFLLYLLGYVAYLLPIILFHRLWQLFQGYRRHEAVLPIKWSRFISRFSGLIFTMLAATSLLHLSLGNAKLNLPYEAGGLIGVAMGDLVLQWFNLGGAIIIFVPMLLIGSSLLTGASWFEMIEKFGAWILQLARGSLKNSNLKLRLPQFSLKLPKLSMPSLPFRAVKPDGIKSDAALMQRAEAMLSADEADPLLNPLPGRAKLMPVINKVAPIETEEMSPSRIPRYSQSTILPKLSLLDANASDKRVSMTKEILAARSEEVEACFRDFSVDLKVVAAYPGPVVTRYELELAPGTKVNKITALAKDLARSLSVVSVRVVEVIPGKSVIGLELPNPTREMVTLKEVLSSKAFQQSRSSLSIALGKDIAGEPVVVDLAKMPHLLVAGTTGSGKSVALNVMLLSLLYKSSPQDLRLILIDPKMLELSIYDRIPHLLAPVVTDMKDAASALRWCVVEMERRYRLMASLGVRNILGYNVKVKEAIERGAPLLDPLASQNDDAPKELQTLPKIVVLADEFADMMVVVGKKVETLIARLAQKARAAGIHLIFATQRPSVDVITGLIKANIPTRIAFQVSSKIDSRTILDQQGAEQLLGHGDMLYLPPGVGVPVRVHGCFASDEEVHRVVNDLKQRGTPDYLEDILDEGAVGADPSGYTESALSEDYDGEKDDLYDEAVEFVVKAQRVSVSSVQRRFKIGYNRAARIVEAMEAAGVVSKMEGNAQREVLTPRPAE